MSDPTIPVGLLDTTMAIITGVVFTLIGIIYQRMRTHIEELETKVDEQQQFIEDELQNQHNQITELQGDMKMAYRWMFGREEDPTNGGIASKIDDGFSKAETRIDGLEEQMQMLIDALVDDEHIDIDRNDVNDD